MAIQSTVTRKFNNGYVQVEIGAGNQEPRYYKVPESKADSFQREYKENINRMRGVSTGITLGLITAAIIPVALITNKIDNKTTRTIVGILAGLAGGVGSMYISDKVEMKNHDKLLKKYNAEIIDPYKSQLPI